MSRPDGFTNAEWHVKATADTGTDYSSHPRQFVITCEWCDAVFFGERKADALSQLEAHREEMREQHAASAGDTLATGTTADGVEAVTVRRHVLAER